MLRAGLQHLTEGRTKQALRTLNVSLCYNVTDEGVAQVLRCPKLQVRRWCLWVDWNLMQVCVEVCIHRADWRYVLCDDNTTHRTCPCESARTWATVLWR